MGNVFVEKWAALVKVVLVAGTALFIIIRGVEQEPFDTRERVVDQFIFVAIVGAMTPAYRFFAVVGHNEGSMVVTPAHNIAVVLLRTELSWLPFVTITFPS
jgi:hypothetical protein